MKSFSRRRMKGCRGSRCNWGATRKRASYLYCFAATYYITNLLYLDYWVLGWAYCQIGWAYFQERGFTNICPTSSLSSYLSSSPMGAFSSTWYVLVSVWNRAEEMVHSCRASMQCSETIYYLELVSIAWGAWSQMCLGQSCV